MPRRLVIPKIALSLPTFVLSLALAVAPGCSRPPAQPDSSASSQRLPFDREPPTSAPSGATLIPSGMRVPQGTFLTIHLNEVLSSATAHAGDTFEGAIDDPVIVDQQTLIPRGSPVTGHVLDSKTAAGPSNPGYLRVTLVSLKINGKIVVVETSSVFAKASPHGSESSNAGTPSANNVVFNPDRRMTFRLAQPLDLQ